MFCCSFSAGRRLMYICKRMTSSARVYGRSLKIGSAGGFVYI